MTAGAAAAGPGKPSFMDKLLDTVERVGNKVPHPVLMFFYLIIGVIVLSAILSLLGVSVTELVAVPVPLEATPDFYEDVSEYTLSGIGTQDVDYVIQERTITINSLLSIDGIRFLFTSFVPNFQAFGALAVTLIAMMGAGAAEVAGLMAALIRKLVKVAPRVLIAYLIVLVGVLSSVASDAGYLILIPLGAAAFLAVGRHPIAGIAAGFGGVAAAFMANLIPTPTDAMLFEITNESIALTGGTPISITADYFFQAVSAILLTVIIGFVIVRVVEPRLGTYDPSEAGDPEQAAAADEIDPALEARGLRWAGLAFLVVLGVVLLATLPPGAPLRDPETGSIIGQTPFMQSLLFIVMLCFFIPGVAFGAATGKYKGAQRRHRRGCQNLCGPGRPDLHAADDQPVHRLLQLLQHAELHRHRTGRMAGTGRHSGGPAVGGLRPGDRGARLHHSGLAGQVGDLRTHLRAALHPAGRAGADRVRRLPRRRLADQHAHAVDGVLPGDRRLRPALSEEVGCWVAGGVDAARCGRRSGGLAGHPYPVVRVGDPAWAGIPGATLKAPADVAT